ncbi:hypothetical protein CDG81_14815 [Actinopolyspora erythraea]|uniref:Uncharacterized protein n=1 Tax=Actinopolyspora erythraea TaxID=414996 RepID=A0A223RTY8_9ACTN|nr:hypothetical protein CDG81_14815 [Actinopolyspora erythraea]
MGVATMPFTRVKVVLFACLSELTARIRNRPMAGWGISSFSSTGPSAAFTSHEAFCSGVSPVISTVHGWVSLPVRCRTGAAE